MKHFKILLLTLLLSVTTLYAQTAKVVYDLTSGDSTKIEKHLINGIKALSIYYEKEKIDFKVIVVISGDAYKYFVEDLKHSPYDKDETVAKTQEHFKSKLLQLNDKYKVQFNMCQSGMKARKIPKETLYKYVHADVMKGVYLISAQNDGYAYMPVY